MTILNLDYPKNWIEANFLIKNIEKELIAIKSLPDKSGKALRLNKLFRAVEVITRNLDASIKTAPPPQQKNLQIAKQFLTSWINKEKFFRKTIENI